MRGQRYCPHRLCGLIVAVCLMLPIPIWAEFYRYTGEDGAIHFTDDLNQVPLDQRDKMEAYTGAPAAPTPAPTPPAPETDASTEAAKRAKEAVSFLEKKRQALVTRQEGLKAEYDRLMKTKAEIEALQQLADTPEKKQALQTEVTALQADIAKYEAQTKALDEEIKAYNSAVEAEKLAGETTQ